MVETLELRDGSSFAVGKKREMLRGWSWFSKYRAFQPLLACMNDCHLEVMALNVESFHVLAENLPSGPWSMSTLLGC